MTLPIQIIMIWLALSAFSLNPLLVPRDEIISGGPGKDGIPALTNPKHEPAYAGNLWLKDDDLVIGISIGKEVRAYPIRILNWHEVVNDHIGKHAFIITYCPLCGSGLAFDSKDRFGVSGLLYQSDMLLYDKQTESLWSQLKQQSIAGKRAGEKLISLPIEHTTWKVWKTQHPNTLVLSRHTGFYRDYNRNPYEGYELTSHTYFPVNHKDNRLSPKTWVIGLNLNGKYKAWAVDALRKKGTHTEIWQAHHILIKINGDAISMLDTKTNLALPTIRLYWFAWVNFHPDTEL